MSTDQTNIKKANDLAMLINAECSICPHYEKRLVASVVVNRIESPNFPGTFQSVIDQKNQFADYRKSFVSGEAFKIADEVLRGKGVVDNVYYFYNPSNATDTAFVNWARMRIVVRAKYHNFCSQ